MKKYIFPTLLIVWFLTYTFPFNHGVNEKTYQMTTYSGIAWIIMHWPLFLILALLFTAYFLVKNQKLSSAISIVLILFMIYIITLPFHLNFFALGWETTKVALDSMLKLLQFGYYLNFVLGFLIILLIIRNKFVKKKN
ncbi:hypothetical protein [Lactococcus fujiensis]|uniref:Uncharacterized protein n=1 Tax=Lactococcus fujiensis JCM 16395 TaxID=1291764 RepID=A0A2A5RLK2_9LACT|nr:hypothetical protein [Lactococcus fujiensis]PCS00157.1 hypothetical protein RT41_GL001468 [Lactococcus fujiensis JCM 16395]